MSEYVEHLALDQGIFRNEGLLTTTLNVVVPCYNEEEVLPETSTRLLALLDRLIDAGDVSDESRIIFVDDGSRDRTWPLIKALHATNAHYGGIKLSRNRGHQNALLAGLLTAQGDVLISLDADLQDDIEAIPRMLEEYRLGAEIVFGVRHKRNTDTFFKRFTARNYYKLLGTFGVDIQPGHADFRLMSRKTVEALRQFQEVNLFLRGIIPLLGFKTAIVEYERAPRFAGESKYPLSKMLAFAFDGITSFSAVPLQWSTRIGALLAFGSLGFGAWAAYARIFTDLTVPGWASTVIPMYFLGGVQLLFLGVIGGYISKTYAETKQRPRFIIEQTL
jgi:glycosyltransferase involved in cell wall biosynthesis